VESEEMKQSLIIDGIKASKTVLNSQPETVTE